MTENKEAEAKKEAEATVNPVEELVKERGLTHGKFSDHARCTQRLKEVVLTEILMRNARGQDRLTRQQVEAIDMILHKIGRIIAGDPSYQDHWDDIAGYATIANKDF